MKFEVALIMLPCLVVGLTFHEFAHAWSASLLGDDFPRRQRRVSLNPFRHLSPLGTLAILLLPFGWGKPVLINPYNFRHPRRDMLLTSLAGPAANLLIVLACFALLQVTRHSFALGRGGQPWLSIAHHMLSLLALINGLLAAFNLVPIPPLDGSKIWGVLFPQTWQAIQKKAGRVLLIVFVVIVVNGGLDKVCTFAVRCVTSQLPEADSTIFVSLYNSAIASYDAKQYEQTQSLLTQALAVNPEADDAYYYRACAKGYCENWQGALEDMDAAIRIEALNPDYYHFRATVLRTLGRTAEAEMDTRLEQRLSRAAASQPETSSAPAE